MENTKFLAKDGEVQTPGNYASRGTRKLKFLKVR